MKKEIFEAQHLVEAKEEAFKKIHNSLFDFSAGGNMVYHF